MKKIVKHIILFIVALVILFEEWLWDKLQALMRLVGKLPILKQIEQGITKLPPLLALCVFLVPALALLPFKILALHFFANKQVLLGTLTYIAAKIVGTALLARIFKLTQPALMQLNWFAKLFHRFIAWKERLYTFLKNTRAWQQAQHIKQTIKQWKGRFFSRNSGSSLFRKWRAAKNSKRHKEKTKMNASEFSF